MQTLQQGECVRQGIQVSRCCNFDGLFQSMASVLGLLLFLLDFYSFVDKVICFWQVARDTGTWVYNILSVVDFESAFLAFVEKTEYCCTVLRQTTVCGDPLIKACVLTTLKISTQSLINAAAAAA